MAKLSSDGKYVTVEKNDTLSAIAKKYGKGASYQQLATWNNISNPNRIYIGQKIYLTKSGASSSSSSSSTKTTSTNSNKVTITHFGLQSNTETTLFVTWNWSKSNTDSYLVEWTYFTRDGVWFVGASETKNVDANSPAASRQSIYEIPVNAVKVRVRIKPISKKKTVNKKETNYWTASWSSYKTYSNYGTLATPSAPDVEVDKFKLTMSLSNINVEEAEYAEFQIYRNDSSTVYKTGKATITATKMASWSYTVGAGQKYKVRCRLRNSYIHSDWSSFSAEVSTVPKAPSGITELKATSQTSIFVDWASVANTDTYELQYTTKKDYFDTSNEVQSTSIDAKVADSANITGLAAGEEYFFRLRCVNTHGESAWSEIKSIVLGKKPSAPTTWSSTTTCITGEPLNLYWVHNSADNSSQTYAELEITIGGTTETHTIKNSEDEELKDKTSVYSIDTTPYVEGTKILWRVRTAGITKEYGDWSVQRTVDIYSPPTLELAVTDGLGDDATEVTVLTAFPFYIYALPGPNTQAPISYHVSIVANESYETVDNIGNAKFVSQGEEVYSEFYDISQSLLLELLPSSVDLENNISYTINVIVSMNSGLIAEASHEFSVEWTDEIYTPNAEIGYDPERYVTHIRPYCIDYQTLYYKVDYTSGEYTVTEEMLDEETLDSVYTTTGETVQVGVLPNSLRVYYSAVYFDQDENPIDPIYYMVNPDSGSYVMSTTVLNKDDISPAHTVTGEEVSMASTDNGEVVYYIVREGDMLVANVTLSVYRREYDGRFVELGTGLKNSESTYITDPHPALDYARYRVIAISDTTGAVSFYDVPGYPIKEIGAIIQWDEEWSNFDTTEGAELEQPPWSGSLLRLLYNIDVSDGSEVDVSHANYIGRSHPVAYYGTQLGVTSSWKMEILKSDIDTLYALRRLMNHTGDVYVREPSGSGYWATVRVSFSQTHCELTIPVSLNITRVEGGA